MKKKILAISLASLVLVVLATLAWFRKDRLLTRGHAGSPVTDSAQVMPPVFMFGIPVDSYYTETGIVKRNKILAQILRDCNLP